MAAVALYIDLLNEQQCPCKLKSLEAKMEELANQNKALEEQLAECRSGDSIVDTSELETKIALLEQEKNNLQNELNRANELKREVEMNLANIQASLEECQANNANSSDSEETTVTLPNFNVSSRGNFNEVNINFETNRISVSEGYVYFEFDTDMTAYKDAGYKVYGVIKNPPAGVIYEAALSELDQRSALSEDSKSEISHGWMQGIVGKQVYNQTLEAYVYLMNEEGSKVYPSNQPEGYVATLRTTFELV